MEFFGLKKFQGINQFRYMCLVGRKVYGGRKICQKGDRYIQGVQVRENLYSEIKERKDDWRRGLGGEDSVERSRERWRQILQVVVLLFFVRKLWLFFFRVMGRYGNVVEQDVQISLLWSRVEVGSRLGKSKDFFGVQQMRVNG